MVFLSREDLIENEQGIYEIAVIGFGDVNNYQITFEKSYITRVPSHKEQEVLEAIYKSCCIWPGSCGLLRQAVSSGLEEGEELKNFCHLEDQTCDRDGHITAVRLASESMECEIVPEIANLRYLERLDLEDNYIFGSLDDAIDIVKDLPLHSLHIGRNEVHGGPACIPPGTRLYETLTYFDVAFNFIEGEIPACVFDGSSLEILTLEGNTLYGQFPTDISEAPKLRHVDLSWNGNGYESLSGPLPDLRKWRHLEYLNLADNQLSGAFPLLPNTVKSLFLNDNDFKGPLPSDMGDYFESMEALDVKNNDFSGGLPESLPLKLQYLNIDQNNFAGPIPFADWFARQTLPLQQLRMGGNRLSGSISSLLAQLPDLWAVNMTQNKLTGNLKEFVSALPKKNQILQFEAGFNQLTGSIPDDISNLRLLHGVEQDYPRRPDKSPAFDLASNQLTGTYPINLALDASDEWHEMFFDVSDNDFTCPKEYLDLNTRRRSTRLMMNDEKCLDRRGFLVSIGADQLKKQP